MKTGTGVANKTNVGQAIQSTQNYVDQGSPNLDNETYAYGRIIDIRYIDDRDLKGSGMLVKIQFDKSYLNSNIWFSLNEPYERILMEWGNKTAFLKSSPRCIVTYSPTQLELGHVEIINDGKQEKQYQSFQKNHTPMLSSAALSLSMGAKPPGF